MIKNHIRLLSGIITLHVISSKSPRIRKPQNIIDPERCVHVRAHAHTCTSTCKPRTHTHERDENERDVAHIAEEVISPLVENVNTYT